MNRNLHLPLEYRWYDLIVNGDKREEYRELTVYWANRLLGEPTADGNIRPLHQRSFPEYLKQPPGPNVLVPLPYETITFRRGYTQTSATYRITGIEIRTGRPEWGAVPGKKYFVISFEPMTGAGLS